MDGTERTCVCPACNRPIGFWAIYLAPCPVWIRCRACRARLSGDRFVWIQAVVVASVAAAGTLPIAFLVWPWPRKIAALLVLVVFLGVVLAWPMTLWTLRRGSFRTRGRITRWLLVRIGRVRAACLGRFRRRRRGAHDGGDAETA